MGRGSSWRRPYGCVCGCGRKTLPMTEREWIAAGRVYAPDCDSQRWFLVPPVPTPEPKTRRGRKPRPSAAELSAKRQRIWEHEAARWAEQVLREHDAVVRALRSLEPS